LSTCVVIPAFNEDLTIGKVVASVIKAGFDVVVVDDCSNDNTAIEAKKNGAIVLSHLVNLGSWRSIQTGIRYADREGYQSVITLDADGQHDIKFARRLISKSSNNNYDVVIGNCIQRGSRLRHLAWKFFRFINKLEIRDITSGFRFYNKEAMGILSSRQSTMIEYQCVGILLLLRDIGMKIAEVPVNMSDRADGISRIFYSWRAVFYYMIYSTILSITKLFPSRRYEVTKLRYDKE
jgi:glycosyltransferase involved in cell wall biosynthesis